MNYLFAGNQTQLRLDTLLRLTKITSEPVLAALSEHLVLGYPLERAAIRAGIPKGNLSRAVDTLNNVASVHEELKEIDCCKKVL